MFFEITEPESGYIKLCGSRTDGFLKAI